MNWLRLIESIRIDRKLTFGFSFDCDTFFDPDSDTDPELDPDDNWSREWSRIGFGTILVVHETGCNCLYSSSLSSITPFIQATSVASVEKDDEENGSILYGKILKNISELYKCNKQ